MIKVPSNVMTTKTSKCSELLISKNTPFVVIYSNCVSVVSMDQSETTEILTKKAYFRKLKN